MKGVGRTLIPFVPYAVLSAVHVWLLATEHAWHGPSKLLLMPALALGALWVAVLMRPRPTRTLGLLLLPVFFSWLGDGAGSFFPTLPELPIMLLSFGIAHGCYLLLMWLTPGISLGPFPRWALIYACAWVVLVAILAPHTGSLLIPVAVYGVLLAATAAMSSRCGPVVAWGGAWFLISDAILAFRLFMPEAMPAWTSPAVMFTYTLGQGLIVYGVLRALRRRDANALRPHPAAPVAT